jgi:hypothetical protein
MSTGYRHAAAAMALAALALAGRGHAAETAPQAKAVQKPTPPAVAPVTRPSVPTPVPADPPPPLVTESAMHVTLGAVKRLRSGRFSVTDPKVRMVVPATQDDAAVTFRYLGATEKTAPLSSGEVRRQVGLKLRAANGCNVLYAMWRFEPKNEVVVSLKRNDGKTTHAQCGANGYENVAPERHVAPAPVRVGQSRTLRAKVTGDRMRVLVDDKVVWEGKLPAKALAFDGPTGMRTDNAKLELDFRAKSRPAGVASFLVVASDDD